MKETRRDDLLNQFYRSSRGLIHVADNPHKMKCGRILKEAAEPMGLVIKGLHDGWGDGLWFCDRCRRGNSVIRKPPVPTTATYVLRGV